MNELEYREVSDKVYEAVRESDESGDNVLWWLSWPPEMRRLIIETIRNA